jgi:O-antigen/teichoic acid export membrane protein
MTGTTIAQALPIAISPILTRLYTPQDFGILGLFLAITGLFGSIVNGRYELAIILPKEDEDAINVAALGFLIASTISISALIFIILFQQKILTSIPNKEIGNWLYLTPISVFLAGIFNVLNYLNIRTKGYKDIAKSVTYKAIALAIFSVAFGFTKIGSGGLIGANIISQFFSNKKLFSNIQKKNLFQYVSITKIKKMAKRYKKLPQYSMPGIFANTLAQSLSSFFISAIYSVTSLGHYTLVQRTLGLPFSIIAQAYSQVYLQEASSEKQKTGKTENTFIHVLKRLSVIGIPTSFILFFTIQDAVTLIFGKEWAIAGSYAKILVPYFCFRFISSPLSTTLLIFEKQKTELLIHLSILGIFLLLSLASWQLSYDIFLYLKLLSGLLSIAYLCFIGIYYHHSKGIKKALK